MSEAQPRSKARSNVYTVLLFFAMCALAAAVTFTWMKNLELTKPDQGPEGSNPFFMIKHNERAPRTAGSSINTAAPAPAPAPAGNGAANPGGNGAANTGGN